MNRVSSDQYRDSSFSNRCAPSQTDWRFFSFSFKSQRDFAMEYRKNQEQDRQSRPAFAVNGDHESSEIGLISDVTIKSFLWHRVIL
jgi:predicted secreted hydrolase